MGIAEVLSGSRRYCVLHSDVLDAVKGMPAWTVTVARTMRR